MMRLIIGARAIFAQYRSFFLYALIGVSGATIDYVGFLTFHFIFGLDLLVSNAVSVSLGITNNFLLNAFLNFRRKDGLLRRFVLFYSVGVLGLGISSFLLKVGVDWMEWNVSVVKFFSIFFVVLVQYNLNKVLAFGSGVAGIEKPKLGMVNNPDALENADHILVLGAPVPNQTNAGPVLEDRLQAALDAYRAGKASSLIVSGRGDEGSAKEVYVMEMWLKNNGVPASAIIIDDKAFRTIDSMKFVKRTFGAASVIVCTQRFHLPRSLFLAKKCGLSPQGLLADRRVYRDKFAFSLRETMSVMRAWWDVARM
jgi:vancomycin permeability regulator SanA